MVLSEEKWQAASRCADAPHTKPWAQSNSSTAFDILHSASSRMQHFDVWQ